MPLSLGGMLRQAGHVLSRAAATNRFTAFAYLSLLGSVGRSIDAHTVQERLANSTVGAPWPLVRFGPRRIRIGKDVDVLLHPHVGEFDFAALFTRTLRYEREVVSVLETMIDEYDRVVEIGANVGVYTLFFAQRLARRSPPGLVFAFEPSREAFSRLEENLRVNRVTNVRTFNCAVAESTQLVPFFEPDGHLTNGSLDAAFARLFASSCTQSESLVLGAGALQPLLAGKVLLKIDAEGSEVSILRGLDRVIEQTPNVDLLIEVLPACAAELNKLATLRAAYRLYNITPDGPMETDHFVGTQYRDYLLVRDHRH